LIPKKIAQLKELEKNNIYNFFTYKDTNSWVFIKDKLTRLQVESKIRMSTNSSNDFKSFKSFITIIVSFIFLLFHIVNRRKKTLYLGATTGLFRRNNEIKDSYFPYFDTSIKSTLQMNNCANITKLFNFKKHVVMNRIVIENFLIVPIKKIYARFIFDKIKKNTPNFKASYISEILLIEIDNNTLLKFHCEFISGYIIYRFLFRLLRVEKSYVVSAATKSDQIAALKSLKTPVIELQHGVIGKIHRGFNYHHPPKSLPIPDSLNVYNKFWKNEIIKTSNWVDNEIKITGKIKYDFASKCDFKIKEKFILFSGQAGFFDDIFNLFKEGNSFLIENNIKLYYKPHPRITHSELKMFKNRLSQFGNISIIEDALYSTEEYIKNCVAHISVFSSCHFDAVHFLGKTYVFDVMEDNLMNYYVSTCNDEFIKIDNLKQINLDIG